MLISVHVTIDKSLDSYLNRRTLYVIGLQFVYRQTGWLATHDHLPSYTINYHHIHRKIQLSQNYRKFNIKWSCCGQNLVVDTIKAVIVIICTYQTLLM